MACRVFGISFLVAVLTIDVLLGQGPDQQVRPEPRSPTPEELEAAAQEVQGVRSLLAIVPLSHVEDPSLAVTAGTWVAQGPGPNTAARSRTLTQTTRYPARYMPSSRIQPIRIPYMSAQSTAAYGAPPMRLRPVPRGRR